MEIKITEYVICRQEAFELKFYYIIQCTADKSNLCFFTRKFYIRTSLFNPPFSLKLLTNYENIICSLYCFPNTN